MPKIRAVLGPLSRAAIVCAGGAAMWGLGDSWPPVVVWLLIAWTALAIDPRGRGRFVAGVLVATLVAASWSSAIEVATMPNQVSRMLFFEFLPEVPTLTRPVVIVFFFWTLMAGLVVGWVGGVARGSWRRCLLTTAAVMASLALFVGLIPRWPGPEQKGQVHPPPLGIAEIFYSEMGPVDLAEVTSVPAPSPVPSFQVRKGLSYGPHGYRNTLDLYLPEGHEGPLPVVIYVHGGGAFDGGTDTELDAGLPDVWRGPLLGQGLAVANINYRLVFANPNSRHAEVTGPFPAQIQDCLAAVRFLRAEAGSLGLDPGRIGVMGHSFGGGIAALAGVAGDREEFLTETRRGISSRVQAVVDSAGLNDVRVWGTQTRYNAKMWNLPTADYLEANEFGRLYCETGRSFDPASPSAANASAITHVRPGAPPFLHMYGFRDVAIQGELLHEHLKQAGVSSRLIIIPGAGHGLAAVPGTGDVMAQFLREQLAKAR